MGGVSTKAIFWLEHQATSVNTVKSPLPPPGAERFAGWVPPSDAGNGPKLGDLAVRLLVMSKSIVIFLHSKYTLWDYIHTICSTVFIGNYYVNYFKQNTYFVWLEFGACQETQEKILKCERG